CGGGGGGQSGAAERAAAVDTDRDGIPDATDEDDDNDGFDDSIDPYPLDPDRGAEPVSVPDPALRDALLKELGKEPGSKIYRHEMAGIAFLSVHKAGVASLEGLQFAVGLKDLHVDWNPISDLTPLLELPELFRLDISYTQVRDFTQLWSMPALGDLHASATRISDLSWLSGLPELIGLEISRNNVSDLSPVSSLSRLRYLDLAHNSIGDLTPLSNMNRLERLDLCDNHGLTDLTPLSNLTRLERLDLRRIYELTDIAPLSSLKSLKILNLHDLPRLLDLEPLSSLTALEELAMPLSLLTIPQPRDLAPIGDKSSLVKLDLHNNNLADVAPLAGLTSLEELDLTQNRVSDLSAFANLPSIKRLTLVDNQVADLSPLVDNSALGEGDVVRVLRNPLSGASIDSHVPALRDRGVEVSFDRALVHASDGPRIHNDNLLVMPIAPGDLATDGDVWIDRVAQRFYTYFEDAFDFLIMIWSKEPVGADLYGLYSSVTNGTLGIGKREIKESTYWGSVGRLQGVISFPFPDVSIMNGPMLHEIMHRWAAYVAERPTHWEYSSGYGQLGGFRAEDLVDLGGGRYAAGTFGLIGNGGNGVPYSPIELYLAGFIPPGEVPDLLVAEDADQLMEGGRYVRTDDGSLVFTASRIARLSIEDIVAEHGIRVPDHTQSQREFRAAALLLIDEASPAYRSLLDKLSEEVVWFELVEDKDPKTDFYNFYQATGGRATMAMGGLSEFNTGTPVPSTPRLISARSARMPEEDGAVGQPRFDLLFQEIEGVPHWPQVLDGLHGPSASHPAWCKHESYANLRMPSATKQRKERIHE
ncbi:MAG: leucine-rich repeat domain-containing protein, partial [Gammaproteobacteria bacterium]|nr:leucine-rich repeat domain-containing protein [Gammaproteobacteria bacterium]